MTLLRCLSLLLFSHPTFMCQLMFHRASQVFYTASSMRDSGYFFWAPLAGKWGYEMVEASATGGSSEAGDALSSPVSRLTVPLKDSFAASPTAAASGESRASDATVMTA